MPQVKHARAAAQPSWTLLSAARSKLARVLHDDRTGHGRIPGERPGRLLCIVEDDEQSRARRAQPAEARVRRPCLRLVAVLRQGLHEDSRREEIRDTRTDQLAFKV